MPRYIMLCHTMLYHAMIVYSTIVSRWRCFGLVCRSCFCPHDSTALPRNSTYCHCYADKHAPMSPFYLVSGYYRWIEPCAFMRACARVTLYACVGISVRMRVRACVVWFVRVCVYVCMRVCIYLCMRVCVYVLYTKHICIVRCDSILIVYELRAGIEFPLYDITCNSNIMTYSMR